MIEWVAFELSAEGEPLYLDHLRHRHWRDIRPLGHFPAADLAGAYREARTRWPDVPVRVQSRASVTLDKTG